MKTMIYIESDGKDIPGAGLELVTAAENLGSCMAVLTGAGCREAAENLAAYGTDVAVMETESAMQDIVVSAVVQAAEAYSPDVVLFAATLEGKDLAPRVAAKLSTGCITDITAIEETSDGLVFTRPAYGGTILEKMMFAQGKTEVASVRAGSFEQAQPSGQGKIGACKAAAGGAEKVKLLKTSVEIAEMVNLEGADVIVAGGRGCGSAENFALVQELADLLGGVVGASRPAIEEGWVSKAHQIGQSGKIVAPKLYIACGISGSMQHVSGMMGSDYIVAINKDEDASIFEVADVAIVGKCEEVLPLMIEEIRKRRA
ncbi:MAG: electron transfer flavoprotein subunit alpha/FixB family protein [Clostridiales bacterium]|nr:electron transfer flavoprotein subunit alpha/FixB family protein [Clostridiales bacterium]